MKVKKSNDIAGILIGGILLLIGIVIFSGNADFVVFHPFMMFDSLFSFQALVFIAGLIILLQTTARTLGIALLVIGGAGFFIDQHVNLIEVLFPLLVIGAGAYMLYKHRRDSKMNTETTLNR